MPAKSPLLKNSIHFALAASISAFWANAGALIPTTNAITNAMPCMQAIAWAIAAGATGIAGALIATFYYIVPTVGETLGIVAFVTVSLGGFGSVPGALVAGLLIGVIESLSGYLISAVYKDVVVYTLFLGFLWFRPQGLMGKM